MAVRLQDTGLQEARTTLPRVWKEAREGVVESKVKAGQVTARRAGHGGHEHPAFLLHTFRRHPSSWQHSCLIKRKTALLDGRQPPPCSPPPGSSHARLPAYPQLGWGQGDGTCIPTRSSTRCGSKARIRRTCSSVQRTALAHPARTTPGDLSSPRGLTTWPFQLCVLTIKSSTLLKHVPKIHTK